MKNFLKTTVTALFILFLTGCSNNAQQEPSKTVVEPTEEADMPAKAADDHHEGETNVAPHDDNANEEPTAEEHHEGEENVEPHDDEPSVAAPPSRSNPVEDHDDTGTEPHND